MDEPVYASDPNAAPDDDFERGRLEHLVPGNAGRLLDPRRTPITVTGLDDETGMFAVEIGAFEDAGARWDLPFEEVTRFQFARGGERASASQQERFRAAIDRLDHSLTIEATATPPSLPPVELALPPDLDLMAAITTREGDPTLIAAVHEALGRLAPMDDAFATQYVSNPWSGELVKGHAIVAAELGLAPYNGKAVRDPHLFDGEWSKERRAEHLLTRLAITGELYRRAGAETATLYRAANDESPPDTTFVSATFSRAVAEAHEKPVIHRWEIPLDRLLMTFWETAAMNGAYREAEAVLFRLQ